jgi:hypothetical protein
MSATKSALDPLELGLDRVRHLDDIGAGSLLHGEGHRRFSVQPGASRLILEAVDDVGDIPHVDRLAVANFDHEIFDFTGKIDLRW